MAQTVIITGATSGLGLLTARRLAAAGWRVIATGRNLAGLTASDREAGIEPVVLNLDALATVDDFVRWLDSAGVERLDALVCNAGGQSRERQFSADGFERTVAVNYLAAMALVDRLVPRLRDGGRVVLIGSGTHNPAEVRNLPAAIEDADLADLLHPPEPGGPGDAFRRYATSKLCLVRVTPRLARDLAPAGITVNTFDPGLMPGTALARDFPPLLRTLWRVATPLLLLAPGAHRPATSARHLADLVAGPRFASMSGAYVVDAARRAHPSPRSTWPGRSASTPTPLT